MASQIPSQSQAGSNSQDTNLGNTSQVSKSELKRRAKQQKAREQKAEKEASRKDAQKSERNGPEKDLLEGDLNPNQYFEIRSRQINRLRETKEPNPYPHKFHVSTTIPDFIEVYAHIESGAVDRESEVQVGVRIMAIRSYGQSLCFYDCKAEGIGIQIVCQATESTATLMEQKNLLKRGDWIGVIGHPGRTKPRSRDTGELSVFAREIVLLSPCLRSLPTVHFGFKDKEQRYRQRFVDLIINDSTRLIFETRTKVIKHIRRFFDDRNFLEVQTPMMNRIAGGAAARPFKTFHNDLNTELYMRVAPELYLKQLVVGGLERVYEIGRQFRNEDIDLTHNPEFTSCEFYWAFADVFDVMNLTEELVSSLVYSIKGSYESVWHQQDGTEYHINWKGPWKRIQMIPALEEAVGEKFPPPDQLHTDEANDFLKRVLDAKNIQCSAPQTNARMIDKLVGEYIESKCINPTFITGHPQVMSPLAKADRNVPGLCERFEVFVCKFEVANAYTELNDPVDQRARFLEQAKDKAKGDNEAHLIDETFCQSLEYALPPTGGWGMGIDRMVMFMTNNYSIREVLTFPMLRDHEENPVSDGTGQIPQGHSAVPLESSKVWSEGSLA